jgi:lipoyl(octanoyl) transferase
MEWKVSDEQVDYKDAVSFMESRVEAIQNNAAKSCVWLLEHPPLYTAGTSAKGADLLDAKRFPVYTTGRGGEYTYHGPGQRVAYVMMDLKRLFAPGAPDLRRYIQMLEQWLISTLAEFGIQGEMREGRVGVWVVMPDGSESKIAALGVRVRKWVCYHGICLNIHPDLSHYAGIVPCGIRAHGVTSLKALGVNATMQEVDVVLKKQFERVLLRQDT